MSSLRLGVATAVIAVACLAAATPAFAHEVRQVGSYEMTVGWAHEPTYTGIQNAVQLFVKDAKGKPVDDLGDPPTLKVQIISGSQTSDPLELAPSFDADTGLGTHGEFDAAVIPTAPGDYTFHFTGTINGQKIDEKFTSSDKTFDTVKEPTEVEFPAKPPSVGQLATNLDRLNPRVDGAVSAAQSAQQAAKSAKDKAGTATILAVVALVAGLVLGGFGFLGGRARRRPVSS
jgi:hypothetical protein